ncbi:MAG: iron-containing alcohol dehydrogenase [Desulfobulbaceae bacterium]|nr:iron-containing alcohol dehydrogenase [Desulfobulbaceae bacterium]
MRNFVLENPTKILFGRDTIKQIGAEAQAFGTTALLVTGCHSLQASGIHNIICASLKESDISIIPHPGVKSNPILSHVRKGVALCKAHGIELIIAAGGGSVIDEAKAIAAGSVVNHDVWKFFKGKASITTPLPICTVLTLAASGSEMNGGMVITNDELNLKLGTGNKKLCPKVSILDPSATFSVPPNYTAYGAIDAIAHTLEFYFTAQDPNTPVQDRFMEGLIINLMEACNQALNEPTNYPARANLMWCATMALNGWTAAGLGLVGFPMHMIEHSMSALYDVPHGAGLSVVIPAWMRWAATKQPRKFAQFAERVFMIRKGSVAERALAGIEHLQRWFERIKSPTKLAALDIPSTAIHALTTHSLAQAKLWRLDGYHQATIEEILQLTI